MEQQEAIRVAREEAVALRAKIRRGPGGFRPGMAAAYHNDIKSLLHGRDDMPRISCGESIAELRLGAG